MSDSRSGIKPMPKFKNCSVAPTIVLIFLVILYLVLNGPAFAFSSQLLDASSAAPEISQAESLEPPAVNLPLTVIDGRIARQPVYTELVACGVPPSDVLSLMRSFKGVFDFRKAQPNDKYQVCLTPENKLQKLIYKTSPTDQYVAVRTDDDAFEAYRREIPLEKETVAKTFTIESSLSEAVTGQGESGLLVAAFADIFSWDIDFYLFPRKGDTIHMVFEKYTLNGRFVKYGQILAAEYIGSKKFSAFYFDDGSQAGYYDEDGAPLRKMFIRVPVKFGHQTSSYSIRRFHPISKRYKRHTGIDYGAPQGTPIFATAGGTVEFAGWRTGYGKLVILRHPNGYRTYYGHCSRLLVAKGAYVKQGQTIAEVGQTGQATGPHVHYEVRIKGTPVDPNSIKTTKGQPLPADERDRFVAMVQARLLMMEDHLVTETHQTADNGANLQ
jgi:murein DD-endopeptidase MepM/ murein hydrolase activator NlpD